MRCRSSQKSLYNLRSRSLSEPVEEFHKRLPTPESRVASTP